MEEAGASLGASSPTVVRRIVLPNLIPAILTGSALAFARSVGEFGSVILIAGNIPYRTELASVYIFGQVEADDPGAAAAISVVLLVASLLLLTAFDLLRRRISRHEEPVA
jgi:sulfate transport system permease protein